VVRARHRQQSIRARVRAIVAAAASVLVAAVAILPASPAAAAPGSVLTVDVTILDHATGAPITVLDASVTPYYDVKIAYSCSTADCEDIVVSVGANPLDPFYGQYRFASAVPITYIPPYPGAPAPVGNHDTGYTFDVGDLGVGQSANLVLTYRVGERYSGPRPGSFFPDGFVITPDVTVTSADSPAATDPAPASAEWRSYVPAGPTNMALTSSADNVRTGSEVTYSVTGDSRCASYNAASALIGIPWDICAAEYDLTVTLPAGAQYVSSSDGGVESGGVVTWHAEGPGAAFFLGTGERTVTVTYPEGSVADGCQADVSVSAHVDLRYLGEDEWVSQDRTTSHVLQDCEPFAGARIDSKTISRDAGTMYDPIVYLPRDAGVTYTGNWQVDMWNTANVDGVATLVDDGLDQAGMPVYRIRTNVPATVTYTIVNAAGVETTGTASTPYSAPSGSRITRATLVSSVLPAPNIEETDTEHTLFRVLFDYRTTSETEVGTRTNTVTGSMTYPGFEDELGTVTTNSASRTATLVQEPIAPPTIGAYLSSSVTGGGTPIVGSQVVWSTYGRSQNIPEGSHISPQYIFLAPVGWDIVSGSASFSAAVPAGADYDYTELVYNGETHQALVVTWPDGATFAEDGYWPTLRVTTTPTESATAGTNTAYSFMGDALNTYADGGATWSYPYVDALDYDGDGNTTEQFATVSSNITLGASTGLGIVKEICLPDGSGGCEWISDPDVLVGVAPTSTDITYRVTITNQGNASVSNIVAYDVLPWIGDTGLLASTSTSRGSTFQENLQEVVSASSNLDLTFSTSTNPPRDEVYPGAPGASGTWDAPAAGAAAIRLAVNGSLAAHASASFTYRAGVVAGAGADTIACNSVAAAATGVAPLEPRAVCATNQQADLALRVDDRLPLQAGRPGTVPFTVENLSGSTEPITLTVQIPEGLTVTSLDLPGWQCEAPDGPAGPFEMSCASVDEGGAPRPVAPGVPEPLELAVVPDADIDLSSLCVAGEVSGLIYDPVESNNSASACADVVSGVLPLVDIAKDDGVTTVRRGDETTYQITVSSYLVAETVSGATVTDALPANAVFVSASDGGVLTGADPGEQGGTVTWALPDLAPSGVPGPDGDVATGGDGSEIVLTVTVRITDDADSAVANTATLDAPDPADADGVLCLTDDCEATDTDGLVLLGLTKTTDAPASGVAVGDTIEYTVVASNDGTVPFTEDDPAVVTDDLADVLDRADFVAGSASVSIDGGAATPVDDPTGDVLTWSGPLGVGQTATLVYQVEVTTASGAPLRNAVYSGDPSTCEDDADEDGQPCAVVETGFGLTLEKTVTSLAQGDDGLWAIDYLLTVTNGNADQAVDYTLDDDLDFGPGIGISSASVIDAPAGVALADPAWSGSGTIAEDASVAGGASHAYTVEVVADALALAGTAAAECVAGETGGFANVASLAFGDGGTATAEACAEPAEPTVTKTLDGAPVHNEDGSWTVVYDITVTNSAESPVGGLAYRLEDELSYPAGVDVLGLDVAGPAGVALDPEFTGGVGEIDGVDVTPSIELVDGVARIPAAVDGEPVVHAYVVTVTVSSALADPDALACGAEGAGYGNWVSLLSGDTEVGRASACADIAVPRLVFTMTADRTGPIRPGEQVVYTVTARNVGDADFMSGDPAELTVLLDGVLDDATLDSVPTASTGTVFARTASIEWSGPLAAGGEAVIRYSIRVGSGGGDNQLTTLVLLTGSAVPVGAVAACPDDPEGADPCLVTLALDLSSLSSSGVEGIVAGSAAAAAMLLAGGVLGLLSRRRRASGR